MRKGITRRWMVNGFAVIVGFLVIVEIAFMVAVRSYYYQGVETALSNRAETYRNSVSMSVAFSNLRGNGGFVPAGPGAGGTIQQ